MACDYVTSMQRTMTFAEPAPLECIEHALGVTPMVESFRAIGSRPDVAREYRVIGVNGAAIDVARSTLEPNTVIVGFGWMGKTGDQENGPAQELLQDVHQTIATACAASDLLEVVQYCSENLYCR